MRTLDQILTKKDYSRKTPASLFYKDSPLWQKLLTISCVVFLAGAGLGEWKPINTTLGGLPKAISLGVIGLAVLYTLFYPDETRLREIWKPTLLYMSLMAALFFWSMVIWIESFAAVPSRIIIASPPCNDDPYPPPHTHTHSTPAHLHHRLQRTKSPWPHRPT